MVGSYQPFSFIISVFGESIVPSIPKVGNIGAFYRFRLSGAVEVWWISIENDHISVNDPFTSSLKNLNELEPSAHTGIGKSAAFVLRII